jgi:MFS family permease
VALAIGAPIFGWMSDRLGKRKPLYFVGCGMAVAGWAAIIFLPGLSIFFLVGILLLTGFSSGCMIISFSFAKESVPNYLAGTVSGVINMGVMMGPTILQPVVGWVLDRKWQGQMVDNVRIYSLEAYQSGFLLMIIWLVFSFILVFFTRETHCRQVIG